jgi:carboxymethylenebutenolidase
MQKDVLVTATDGGTFTAHIRYPATDLPAPAVVVIQEIFGINAVVRQVAEHLAQAGYVAICPDLFWRQEPGVQLTDQSEAEWARAFALFKGFNVDLGIADLKATLDYIRNDPLTTGKAGTVGYCLGGKLAWLMAARSDSDCNVAYYGVGIEDLLGEAAGITKPLLMHVAEKDQFVPLEAQDRIIHALNDRKNIELNVYPGVDHAFARPGGKHYDKEAAHLANARTADFLARHLSSGRRK